MWNEMVRKNAEYPHLCLPRIATVLLNVHVISKLNFQGKKDQRTWPWETPTEMWILTVQNQLLFLHRAMKVDLVWRSGCD